MVSAVVGAAFFSSGDEVETMGRLAALGIPGAGVTQIRLFQQPNLGADHRWMINGAADKDFDQPIQRMFVRDIPEQVQGKVGIKTIINVSVHHAAESMESPMGEQ
jgi:hypothetical protein